MTAFADAFRDVDADDDPERCAAYLRTLSSDPLIDAGKRARDALLSLRPGASVLDVGCGLGDDIRRLARLVGPDGRAVGLDASAALLERAASTPSIVEWVAGDAHELPFADASFDATRVERTLQHLADPSAVVTEVVRVTRPGGVVCLCEPDWGTLAISTGPREAAESVRRGMLWRVRQGDIGRNLAALLNGAGVERVDVHAEALVARDGSQLASVADPLAVAAEVPNIGEYLDAIGSDPALVVLLTLVTAVGRP